MAGQSSRGPTGRLDDRAFPPQGIGLRPQPWAPLSRPVGPGPVLLDALIVMACRLPPRGTDLAGSLVAVEALALPSIRKVAYATASMALTRIRHRASLLPKLSQQNEIAYEPTLVPTVQAAEGCRVGWVEGEAIGR